MSLEANAAPVAVGASTVGVGVWLWRAGALAGLLGTGAASMYYKGKAEATAQQADSEALELERQRREFAEEQARLAEIQREKAELASRRIEMRSDDGSDFEINTEFLVVAVAIFAILALWYGQTMSKAASAAREDERTRQKASRFW